MEGIRTYCFTDSGDLRQFVDGKPVYTVELTEDERDHIDDLELTSFETARWLGLE